MIAVKIAPLVVVMVALLGVVGAQTTDIRSRVVDAAVSLQFNVRGRFDENRTRVGARALAAEWLRGSNGKVSQARCSGTFIFYGTGEKRRALILTASHCVEGSRRVLTRIGDDGKEKKIVVYDDAQFSYTVIKQGRKVGEVSGVAKVLACGEPEEQGGDDLALLEALDPDMGKGQAEIIPADKPYDLGATAWNCSTLWGEFSGSLLTGIVSSRGFIFENKAFDTTNLSVRPGSSGSGFHVVVDGKPYLAGVITRWDGRGAFGMAVPIERLRAWLIATGYGRLAGERTGLSRDLLEPKPAKETPVP